MLSLSPPAGRAFESRSRSPITAAARASMLLATWTCLTIIITAQTLPYIPTNIFLPGPKLGETGDGDTGGVAYIFSPHDDSVDLLAVNISSTLAASSLPLYTVSSDLPFLESSSTAFVPSLADNGSMLVYAGDCSSSSSIGIWSFNLSTAGDGSTSSWVQEETKPAEDAEWFGTGPGFLSAGFSFSTILEPEISPANMFVYGGMCPSNSSDSTSSQSNATYSNQMVKISPSMAGSRGYTVEPVASSGPPIPEAGFTFTSLGPSLSNRSSTIVQRTNYVLLGGHTQYAFINMSTVAVWSVPQESWSFVSDIGMAETSSSGTDSILERDIERIDSRSGHTAVLNEAGTALVIFGGWVGDLSQAAFPQLAVLQIGSDFGGEGDWQWSIPDAQQLGDGIYGHGAALLPGNVMMIYGGYTISSSGSHKRQKAGSSAASFLNLTSMTWLDSYVNPSYARNAATGTTADLTGAQKRKVGLGLGLGLGLGFLVVIAIVSYLFWRRRQRRNERTVRDSTIRALAQDNSRFLGHDEFSTGYEQGHTWYIGGPDPYVRGGQSLGYQSLQGSRRNWFGDVVPPAPPMAQINRKPVAVRAARGQHQSASSADFEPASGPRGMGGMNPIIEADEDDTREISEEAIGLVGGGRRDSGAYSDPFLTPTRENRISFPTSIPSSQTPGYEERKRASGADPDVQDWITNVDAADALLSGHAAANRTTTTAGAGRASPSRRRVNANTDENSSRTGSNVSESNRSNLSRSGSFLRQLRPGFGVAAAVTTEGRGGSSSSSSTPSYNTARSSFPALQAEGPGLLTGQQNDGIDVTDDGPQEPGSPSKDKPRRSWLGSLRRVFTNSSADPDPAGDADGSGPFQYGVVEANDFQAHLGSLGGVRGIAAEGLLRRKSGRAAWESDVPRGPLDAAERSAQQHPDDEEWDIEKAVEKRLVQVMFTVPKEPLRITNAEPDFVSEQDIVLVGSESEEEGKTSREKQKMPEERFGLDTPILGGFNTHSRPMSRPSSFGDGEREQALSLDQDYLHTEENALRYEFDRGSGRFKASGGLVEKGLRSQSPELRMLSRPDPFSSDQLESHAAEHDFPQHSPLLHHSQRAPKPDPDVSIWMAKKQIDKLGAELDQARSAAPTPASLFSHHSEADILSAEAIRYERPLGSTSTLHITPALTSSAAVGARNRGRAGTSLQKSVDFRSESNLRSSHETRSAFGSTTPRRVREMVEEFESKSSREGSPSRSPVKP